MTETVKIWMPKEDADIVQALFDRSEDPKFAIVHKFDLDGTDCVELEIVVDSSLNLWFLAKTVALEQEFKRRIDEALEKAKKQIASSLKNLKK